MAYYTDTVTSFALLKSAIETHCVSNGWTLADGILSKDSCFLKLTANTDYLLLNAGLGQTSSTLTTPCSSGVAIRSVSTSPILFPIKYMLHIFSNEVYCIINYNTSCYQQISFGKSSLSGIGLGFWATGAYSNVTPGTHLMYIYEADSITNLSLSPYDKGNCLGLFCDRDFSSYSFSSIIYTSLDSKGWTNSTSMIPASSIVCGLLSALPNLSNQASVLLPIKSVIKRSSGGLTIAANLQNARLLRLDNHQSEDLITFGSDQWKVYPWLQRDINNRNIVSGRYAHSGTFGFAIRYEV